MRNVTDTALRTLAMLQAIPQHPRSKSTRQIWEELRARDLDFDVTVRSIQRNLERLSATFPIAAETHGPANHWYWVDKTALTQLPAMSPPTALVLCMAREYLTAALPPGALRQLDAYFKHADRVLGDLPLGRWRDRAKIIQRGPVLKPPSIPSRIQSAVYDALLDGRQLEVDYRNRTDRRVRGLVLNPLGIVLREGVVYLVATASGFTDVRHFALHRMRAATVMEQAAKVPKGFRLAKHVQEGQRFSYPVGTEKLELKALFRADAAIHLIESRLSADHRATVQDDGRVLVEATVADTADLRWWLLGFGPGVEVMGPTSLRKEFAAMAEQSAAMYGKLPDR